MTVALDNAGVRYKQALADIRDSMVFMDSHVRFAESFEFTPATLAKLNAAMSKIQMSARKIVQTAIDAEIECRIAEGAA